MINNNDIDKLFQQSLEDFSDTPSNMVWSGIETQLIERNKQVHSKRKYKTLFYLTLSLLIILSSLLLGLYFQKKDNAISNINTTSNNLTHNIFGKSTNTPEVKTNKNLNNLNTANSSNIQSLNDNETQTQQLKPETQKPILKNRDKSKTDDYVIKNNDDVKARVDLLNFENQDFNLQNKSGLFNKQLVEKEVKKYSYKIERNELSLVINESSRNLLNYSNLNTLDLLVKKPELLSLKMPAIIPSIQTLGLTKRPFFSRISFSPTIDYSLSYRKLKGKTDQLNFFDLHEKRSYSLSYGAKIGIDINNNWRFEIGGFIQNFSLFSNLDIVSTYNGEGKVNAMVFTSFNTNDVQFILNNYSDLNVGDVKYISGTFKQDIKWLNIPFMLGYGFYKGKLGLDISAGISANIFLDEKLSFYDSQNVISDYKQTFSETSNQMFYSYRGELNLHYFPITNFNIFAGIHYQNALTSANKNKSIGFYPYRYGLQLGVKSYL